jgi:PST family polysaccharide transporter
MIFLILTHRLNGALLAVVIQSGLIGIIMLIASIKQPWFKIKYWWAATEHKHKKAIGGYVLMAMTSALTKPVSLILIRNSLVANVGWEQAGQWQAVWKISEVYLAVITIALGTYFLPRLASISGVSNIRKEINNTARIVLPIVCVLAFSVFLLRDVAIYILYTEEFKAARDLFGIQLIGDVLKVLSFLYAYPMISRGATKWFVTSEILFSLTFVILGFVFIQSFGTQGANIAYLVSYFLYFLIIYLNLDNFSR